MWLKCPSSWRNTELLLLGLCPFKHGEWVRFGVKHVLVERDDGIVGEEEVEVFERLREEEAAPCGQRRKRNNSLARIDDKGE